MTRAKMRTMRVESGPLRWTGLATTTDEAIIKALSDHPDTLGQLLRVHDGLRWFYISSEAALKIAGYSSKEVSE